VHIIGPHASDLIAEAALAVRMGLKTKDIGETIHAHPTLPEALMEASEDVFGRAIHIPQK
jgi:dihydrolipoamide dehydrogenase